MNRFTQHATRITLPLLCALCALLFVPPAPAGDWNNARGMGGADEYQFSGSGELLSVVTSVHSNANYWITAGNNTGNAAFEQVLVKSDLTGFNLDYYVATNSWQLASNQMAGTNILWLTATNSGLNSNDVLVYRSLNGESVQLTLLSGNATDAGGLVFTNALGENAVKLFNTLTNAVLAGDMLYKMARVQRFNPFSDHAITNKVLAPWNNWLSLTDLASQPVQLRSKISVPTAVVATFSNAGSLFVSGQYIVRQRR
jgi:hypothetical protein